MATDADQIDDAPDEAAVVDDAPPVDPPQLSEVETLAAEMGWKPETQFSGPKEKWKPAREFVLAERNITRDLKKDVRGLRDQVERMAAAGSAMTARALRDQAKSLNADFDAAVKAGDTEGAAAAVNELRELEQAAAAKPDTAETERDFATRNPWYGKDEDATDYAITISRREATKGKSQAEQIAAVEAAIAKRFPEYVGEQQRPTLTARTPPAVSAPTRAAPRRGTGYADLPPEVRKAADGYVAMFKDKLGDVNADKIKADYARDFFAGQA